MIFIVQASTLSIFCKAQYNITVGSCALSSVINRHVLCFQELREVTVYASDFNGVNGSIDKLHLIAISNGNVLSQQVHHIENGLFPRDGEPVRNMAFAGNSMPYVDIVAFYYDARHDPIVDVLRLTVRHECDEAKVRISYDIIDMCADMSVRERFVYTIVM